MVAQVSVDNPGILTICLTELQLNALGLAHVFAQTGDGELE
ncbi:hypothetical protein JOF46_000770 [Paeniglutamicibacter psychrophenolicus]|uniref:Uncharacterized protein n=1 Tax=Paeniglutamicibacter psychrophenolicus TaxID=257454 RepID=A0ABS4W9Q1_9MICC|nr:hypothetical protein [Paeniglutamicibacter psychrophenolicus]